jgi:hypothetical protein
VLPGGLVVIASTPWAETGLLFDEFSRNYGAPVTALACHAPTTLMRTDDARILSMVAREVERDPINAEREFGALFLSGGAGLWFDAQAIHASTYSELLPALEAPAGVLVGVGVDLALARDAAALVAVHHYPTHGVYDIAEVVELRPQRGKPLRLSEVIATFAGVTLRHGCHSMTSDFHEYYAALEHLPPGVLLTAAPGGQTGKIDAYTRSRDLLHGGFVRIPAQYSRLGQQLRETISKPTSGGGVLISSPRRGGSHGDVASACVLALASSYNDPTKLFGTAKMTDLLWRSQLFST